jgi:hypothetical protein
VACHAAQSNGIRLLTIVQSVEQALLALVRSSNDYVTQNSRFGTKYVVVGNLSTPYGRHHVVTTVWIVEPPDDRPRLVTAYPGDHR